MLCKKGELFHVISRAVDERKIFADDADCYRFIFQIYAANLGKPNFNLQRLDIVKCAKALLNGEEVSSNLIIEEHSPLVNIFDFVLNVTHYHFRLSANADDNVSLFIKKLNIGFAKYFNLKYNRKGSLFGSRYKGVVIETDFQADAVSRYVSIVNPLDIYQPGWRENGLANPEKAIEFLGSYPFSSFLDKVGKRKSKIITLEEGMDDVSKNYIKLTKEFLKENQSVKFSGFEDV